MGGNTADNGDVINAEYLHILHFFEFSVKAKLLSASNGKQTIGGKGGVDGSNGEKIEHPIKPQSINNLYMISDSYKHFLTSHLTNNIQKSVLNEFLNEFIKKSLFSKSFEQKKIDQKPNETKRKTLRKRLSSIIENRF